MISSGRRTQTTSLAEADSAGPGGAQASNMCLSAARIVTDHRDS